MNPFLRPFQHATLIIRDDVTRLTVWKSLQVRSGNLFTGFRGVEAFGDERSGQAQVYTEALDVDVKNGKIIQPVRLRISAIRPGLSQVESIINAFSDSTSTFAITSRPIWLIKWPSSRSM